MTTEFKLLNTYRTVNTGKISATVAKDIAHLIGYLAAEKIDHCGIAMTGRTDGRDRPIFCVRELGKPSEGFTDVEYSVCSWREEVARLNDHRTARAEAAAATTAS